MGIGMYTTSFSPAARSTKTAIAFEQTATAKYNTLFQDDFSDTNSGWGYYTNANGSADYESGGYRINIITAKWIGWDTLPDVFQNDVRIEVDATNIGEVNDNQFGVICRYQDDANYYYLAITSDGYAAIFTRLQGEFTIISSEDKKWVKVGGIYPGSEINHIRADCIGSALVLYANGTQVAAATDSSLTGGQVGLLAGTFDTGGTDILFKNFYVYRP